MLVKDEVFVVLVQKNLSDLAESFSRFELEYGMFNVKISGVKVWQYIRNDIYDLHLRVVYGFFDGSGLKKIRGKEDKKAYKLWDCIKEKTIYNQAFIGRRDALIFASARKVIDNGCKYRDVYTDIIDKKLRQSHYLLDSTRLPQESPNLIYIDCERFKKAKGIKNESVNISRDEFESKIIQPIETYYDIQLNNNHRRQIFIMLQKRLENRKSLAKYYHYILKKSRPKVILIVGVHFEMTVLCAVAKKRDIPVVVLQHGEISTTEPTYNSQKTINLSTYPDYFFVFSELEKKRGRFMIPSSRVIPVGYPELDEYIKNAKQRKSEKEKKEILIISCIDENLLKFTNELAEKVDGTKYRIVYKLHPVEYGNWREAYGSYLLHPNIEVAGDNSKIIYDYFMDAEWVVGMQSTCLYEATAFSVKMAILDSPFKKDYDEFFELGRANLISGVEDLLAIIDRKDINSKASTAWFENNSMEKVQRAIDDIIASGFKE